MHISVTDLSDTSFLRTLGEQSVLALSGAQRIDVSEQSIASTLSCSGALVLVIHRAKRRLTFNVGYSHPLVSAERAASIAVALESELERVVAGDAISLPGLADARLQPSVELLTQSDRV